MKNRTYTEEEFKILKRAYIDYLQLERQLSVDIGDTEDLEEVYNYFSGVRGVSFTNVDLDCQFYFDFNYKDMCLTISKNNYRSVCKLADSVEIWGDDTIGLIDSMSFTSLEKLVLGYEE